MSIRMLAVELYGLIKDVEGLEKKLEESGLTGPERDEIEQELRRARAERDRVQRMLDGAKEG